MKSGSVASLVWFVCEEVISLGESVVGALTPPSAGCCAAHSSNCQLKQRTLFDPLVSSNYLLLLPMAFYVRLGCIPAAVALCISFSFSFVYHLFREVGMARLAFDQLAGMLAFGVTTYTAFCMEEVEMTASRYAVALCLVALAFWFKKQQEVSGNYDVYHTLWHVAIVTGQLYLTFLISTSTSRIM